MDQLDCERLARDLITALRGRRSRGAFSRRLGFRFNQVQRWESGQVALRWPDFLRMLEAAGKDPRGMMKRAFGFGGDPYEQAAFFRHLGVTADPATLARELKISTEKLKRWTSGRQALRLVDALDVIDRCTTELYRFLEEVAPIERLPSIQARVASQLQEEAAYAANPHVGFVLSALDLVAYRKLSRHDDRWVARKAGLTPAQVTETIAQMLRVRAIEVDGRHYRASRHQLSPHHSTEGVRRTLMHIVDRNREFVDTHYPAEGSITGYQIFSLNSKQYAALKERYRQFYHEVCKIVNEGQTGADSVYSFFVGIVEASHSLRTRVTRPSLRGHARESKASAAPRATAGAELSRTVR